MDRNIKLLALFNFFTDFKLYSGILIIYFAQVTGSYMLAMSLFAATTIASAFFEVPTGIYSDRIGRQKTVFLGTISAVFYSIFYALGTSYWLLLIGAILDGLSKSWYSGNNDALLYESVAETKDGKTFEHHLGTTSSLFQVALAISAVIGSILAARSFHLILWLSVIPQIICVIISLKLQEPKKKINIQSNVYTHMKEALQLFIKDKRLQLITMYSVVQYGCGEAIFSFRSAFVVTLWPLWAVGFSKVLSFIGAAISFWFSGRILKRIKPATALVVKDITNRIIEFVSYGFPTVYSPVLLSSTSIFYGIGSVATTTILQKQYSQTERATMDSLVSLFGNIAYAIIAILIGYIADTYSPRIALIGASILLITIIPAVWKLMHK